jgi:hypothetical protein
MFPTNLELNLWTITTNADVEVDVMASVNMTGFLRSMQSQREAVSSQS